MIYNFKALLIQIANILQKFFKISISDYLTDLCNPSPDLTLTT